MKIKIGIVILAAVCIGLLIALLATKKSAEAMSKHDKDALLDFSAQLDAANINLSDMRQVNLMLTNDLAAVQQVVKTLSNNLATTTSALSATKESLITAEGQIVNLNGRIGDLEAQNKSLDERAAELTSRIAELDVVIAETQRKLASSQTDNAYLPAELQKQLALKTELERNFNDLNVVRAQVKKLRDELFVARRLEWMANGTDPSTPQKGAAQLMQRTPASASSAAKAASPYDLNVEVGSDGSVRVIPPPTDNSAQAAAREALLKEAGTTNTEAR